MSEQEQKKLETCKDCKGNGYQRHLFEEGNIEAVNEYVMRDVEATHQLYEQLKQYIF